MINCSDPIDWRDLQTQVNQILRECGLESEVEKDVQTVRGTVNIDVYAKDDSQSPPISYLCECKYWRSSVPQTVIHAFRTVLADYGANWGFIISTSGFQAGAFEAVKNSNVKLLNWNQFQEIFVDRWLEKHLMPRLYNAAEPLVEYTEPINGRIFRKADNLSESSQERFIELRHRHVDLAFLAIPFYMPLNKYFRPGQPDGVRPSLPLRASLHQPQPRGLVNLPDELLDASCLRDFLDIFCQHLEEAIAEFDQAFGERA